MENTSSSSVFGILYPGELGSSLGKLFVQYGLRVVTTTQGRSARTQYICGEAGLTVLPTIDDVVRHSDVVVSVVFPGAAIQVASAVAALASNRPRKLLYVDANSISPMTAREISELLGSSVDFVDACVLGMASLLREQGVFCLSGLRAHELAEEFARLIRVKVIGDTPGQASAFKMIIGTGIPKGLAALFIELMSFARDMGVLGEALQTCNEFYPGIMQLVTRILPTYPQHAGRRSEELRELEETMLVNETMPQVAHGVRQVIACLAGIDWRSGRAHHEWNVAEVIDEVCKNRALSAPAPQYNSHDRAPART